MPDQRACSSCNSHPDPRYRQFAYGVSIGHDSKAHRIINTLWWGGVRNVGHFHEMDEDDLRAVPGISAARANTILERRQFPGNAKSPITVLRRAATLAAGAEHEWARALAGAFTAAADNYAYCRRVNARNSGEVPELPDPTSEELVGAARLLVEATATPSDLPDSPRLVVGLSPDAASCRFPKCGPTPNGIICACGGTVGHATEGGD